MPSKGYCLHSSFLLPHKHFQSPLARRGSSQLIPSSSLVVVSTSLSIPGFVFWTMSRKPAPFLKCSIQNLMQPRPNWKRITSHIFRVTLLFIHPSMMFAFFATGDLLLLTHRQFVIHTNPLYSSQHNYTWLFPYCVSTINCFSAPCTHLHWFAFQFFQIISPIHLGNFEFQSCPLTSFLTWYFKIY